MAPNENLNENRADHSFDWTPHPEAGKIVRDLVDTFVSKIGFLQKLAKQMKEVTGTRLVDWIDHFELPSKLSTDSLSVDTLFAAGFTVLEEGSSRSIYKHLDGLFPVFIFSEQIESRVGIKVESIVDFVTAHEIKTNISSTPYSAKRVAKIATEKEFEVWAIEKHGLQCWEQVEEESNLTVHVAEAFEKFRLRDRRVDSNRAGFVVANQLIDETIERVGVDRTCDLFFECERIYWESRNQAARIQKSRQDRLGLGWANHDHHTYRSSRESFSDLIAILEKLGFKCRERFYAGAEAGWGAQVLEQERCGLVVFADVDMSEEELAGDFAHEGFAPRDELGTVGLWCALHGEAFLEAGMHHLECQFDYLAAREVLKSEGVVSMDPFTDFDFLKQCFTNAEIWSVGQDRLEKLVAQNSITAKQAEKFRQNGAVGSHLEILERNDGYKGFNQTGVSKIIAKTDPRKQQTAS